MATIILGLVWFLALAWWPLRAMVEPAYPTSFYQSPVPLTVQSVARGAQVYAENCVACHGTEGRGDGPLAPNLPTRPADLTAEHIFGHADGDLFWWISQGIPKGGMPGFAEVLDESRRWDVINFVHARASAARHAALLGEVTPGPALPAPDFAFDQAGRPDTLLQASKKQAILLVFYHLPFSRPRLEELAAAEDRLAAAGLRLLAVPIDPPAADGEAAAPLPDFAASTGADTAKAYALFESHGDVRHSEFLVDRAGFLRARWEAATPTGLADAQALTAQLERLAQLPLEEQEHAHVHAH